MLHMKTKLIVSAIMLALGSTSVCAADVTLFGTAETSINIQKFKGEKTTSKLATGDYYAARIGIRGREDLGNGYKVRFTLENGFDSGTGETIASFDKNSIFSREASVGLITPYGEIGFGRFGSLSSGLGTYALQYFASPYGNGFNELGFGNIFQFVPRTNNTIALVTPNFDGLDFRVLYSNGILDESTEGFGKNTKYLGIGAKYVKGNFGGTIFYERVMWPNMLETEDGGSPDDHQSLTMAANYKFGNGVKLYGGYQYYTDARMNYGMTTSTGGFPVWPQLTSGLGKKTVSQHGMEAHAFMTSLAIPLWGGRIMPGIGYVTGKDKAKEGSPKYNRFVGGVAYEYPLSKSTLIWMSSQFSKGGDLFDSKEKMSNRPNSRTYEQQFNSRSFIAGLVYRF